MTRTAISPRLAISIFLNRTDGKHGLPVFHRLPVHYQFALDDARGLRFDLVHELHGLDDAKDFAGLDTLAHSHEGRRIRGRGFVERADDGRLDQHEVGIGRGPVGFVFARLRRDAGLGWRGRELRRRWGRVSRRRHYDLVRLHKAAAANTDPVFAALHLKLRYAGFRRKLD